MAQPRRDQDDQDGDESRNDGPDQPCVTSCPPVVLGPAISPAAATRSPTDQDANPTPGSPRALTWSGRRDSNPRPPPWQGASIRPPACLSTADLRFCLEAVRSGPARSV